MENSFLNKIKLFFSKKILNLNQDVPDDKVEKVVEENKPKPNDSQLLSDSQNSSSPILTIYSNKENSMFNYGIGGQSVPQEASEALADISPNRSIFVQKLTQDEPLKPEAVYDLKTVEEVFEHFKPKVSVDFETADGTTRNETLHFANVGDFGVKSITEKSPFLQELSFKQEQYQKIIKQLKSNKILNKVLEKQESKAAFVNALQSLINELEENK
jgi:hypothetical protein